ncbi:hypothetical protein LZ620_20475, partial [Aeromonas salmonicida]|nr:hypothetical protein [Aeromonas salmonicida]
DLRVALVLVASWHPPIQEKIINDELLLPTKWIKLSLIPLHFDIYAFLIANKRQNVDKYCF